MVHLKGIALALCSMPFMFFWMWAIAIFLVENFPYSSNIGLIWDGIAWWLFAFMSYKIYRIPVTYANRDEINRKKQASKYGHITSKEEKDT